MTYEDWKKYLRHVDMRSINVIRNKEGRTDPVCAKACEDEVEARTTPLR